jgi:hypothetical protein
MTGSCPNTPAHRSNVEKVCALLSPGFSMIYPGWRLEPDDYGTGIVATNDEKLVVFMLPSAVVAYTRDPSTVVMARPAGDPTR